MREILELKILFSKYENCLVDILLILIETRT